MQYVQCAKRLRIDTKKTLRKSRQTDRQRSQANDAKGCHNLSEMGLHASTLLCIPYTQFSLTCLPESKNTQPLQRSKAVNWLKNLKTSLAENNKHVSTKSKHAREKALQDSCMLISSTSNFPTFNSVGHIKARHSGR